MAPTLHPGPIDAHPARSGVLRRVHAAAVERPLDLTLRVLLATLGAGRSGRGARPCTTPPRTLIPPRPVFTPRVQFVADRDGEACLEFPGARIPLASPFDWRLWEDAGGPDRPAYQLHAFAWCEALDDAAFQAVVLDWIAVADPARGARGVWTPALLAERALSWMAEVARRRRRLAPGFLDALDASLAAQLRALALRADADRGGCRLLSSAAALCWAGATYGGVEADRWAARGRGLLERELTRAFRPDGLHASGSAALQAEALAHLLTVRAVTPPGTLCAALDDVLARGAQALADLTHPDGAVSLLRAGRLHPARLPGEVLDAVEQALGVRSVARDRFVLSDAGLCGARRGQSLVVADCGWSELAAARGRPGAGLLDFEWTVAGERLVVGLGASAGTTAAARTRMGPDTLDLDGGAERGLWAGLRAGRRAGARRTTLQPIDGGFVLEAVHDGYEHLRGEPLLRRRLWATPEAIEIVERVEGGAGQLARSRLLLHPLCRVVTDADGVLTLRRGRALARVVAETPIAIEDATWFPDHGERVATRQLVVTHGAAPCVAGIRLRAISP
ncbi:MAG: heparinase II/III family protein [Planctomycetes bacterium]|nr:heparinase II/III family protein [Planctomycetota bacterium]